MIKNKKILSELKDCLQGILDKNLQKIILYGSYARCTEIKESDIDFLVLTDLSDIEIRKVEKDITSFSTDLSLKYNLIISIVVVNSGHYSKYLNILPFYKNISDTSLAQSHSPAPETAARRCPR